MPRDKAIKLVKALGIPMYYREDGHLYQHPPGEELLPEAHEAASHGRSVESTSADAIAGSPVGSAQQSIDAP